jgi:hypothetical protein
MDNLITKLNYGAFGLHLASAIGLTIAFSIIKKDVSFDTGLWAFKITSISEDNRDITLEAYDYLNVSTISLETILVLIFLITAMFHIYYARSKFYKEELNRGYNRIRWLEYAITSSLMIFILSILAGVKGFDSILSLCVINATLMSFGYYFELAKDNISKILSLSIGFILLLFIWFIILSNFGYRIKEVTGLGKELPIWVYGVLTPMFFWWISFGLVASYQYIKGGDFKKYEMYYIILSFLSKAFMGYYLAYGMLGSR